MKHRKMLFGTALGAALLVLACADEPTDPLLLDQTPSFATAVGTCVSTANSDPITGGPASNYLSCSTPMRLYGALSSARATVVSRWNAGVHPNTPQLATTGSGGIEVVLDVADASGTKWCGKKDGSDIKIQQFSASCTLGGVDNQHVSSSGQIADLIQHELHAHFLGINHKLNNDSLGNLSFLSGCPINSYNGVTGAGCLHEWEAEDWVWGVRPIGVDWGRELESTKPSFLSSPDSLGVGTQATYTLSAFAGGMQPDSIAWSVSSGLASVPASTNNDSVVVTAGSTEGTVWLVAESAGENVRFPWPADSVKITIWAAPTGISDITGNEIAIHENESCGYTAVLAGGSGPHEVTWYKKLKRFQWTQVGTGDWFEMDAGTTNFDLKAELRVSGVFVDSRTETVTVTSSGGLYC